MQLPPELNARLDDLLAGPKLAALERASARLSSGYRAGRPDLAGREGRLAYLATRLPATYAALRSVLAECAARLAAPVRSLLDLGAGPGSAGWAAAGVFPDLTQLTCLERDRDFLALGRELAAAAPVEALRAARWREADLTHEDALEPHDLVVAGFSLGELGGDAARRLLGRALAAARLALVVVEPGTPAGFEGVRALRDRALAQGARVLAPCPHERACPLQAPDWCHFAARVERRALHRRLKGGQLGHEDEKFSYVVLAPPGPEPAGAAAARVLRHPLVQPGRITLELCAPEGLRQRVLHKRDGALWRAARRAGWGDAWSEPAPGGPE